jgi:dynein heavy chain, axonemal
VLAVKFRVFAKMENLERKWLIFDGPVDAIWIENMNTVLDDNKKLCLNSGEIIAMAPAMNLIFEPADLLVASPATVSRCGMVYMEPAQLGWMPLFESWKNSLPDSFLDEDYIEIQMLFTWAVDPILEFMRKNCHEISPTQNTNLVVSLMRIFKSLNKDLADPEFYSSIEGKNRIILLDNRFVFAIMWSLGGSVNTEYRKSFDLYVKKLFGFDIQFPPEVKRKKISLPDRSTLYDWKYDLKPNKEGGEWVLWTHLIDPNEIIPAKASPQELIIKTVDTVRYSFLLVLNILNEVPTLFCGPTGTGKSVYIQSVLRNSLEKDKYSSIDIGFSAQTSAAQTQEIIESKLDRIRKGVFGPKQGKCIIFVDDLNMPAKETWGAQPPIEILRQMIDQVLFKLLFLNQKKFLIKVSPLMGCGKKINIKCVCKIGFRHLRY